MSSLPHRIIILGGGFAGVYAAIELEKKFANDPSVEITLVNRDNFFLFTPMLHEVAASDLDITNIVNPVRKLLRKVHFFAGDVDTIDLTKKTVTVSHGLHRHSHEMPFDQLVITLGSTTNFFGLPGLEENAITMKSLEDAVNLRNRLIALLEEADTECSAHLREPLLTVVVAGGGFAGVETLASINDFLRGALKHYTNIRPEHLRLLLVHPGEVILPELGPKLGGYAQKKLEERGIQVLTNTRVSGYDGNIVALNNGTTFPTHTVIWTAGTTPNALLKSLPCEKDRGRLKVDATLEVPGHPGVWALGDCALVPDKIPGKFCPPTAQHALREGKTVAHNIAARMRGGKLKKFSFVTLGQLAAIGHRTGVANVFGINFSGFVAWWLWRTIYLSKLPRFEKKLRVALDWTLDVLFSKDLVQFVNVGKIHLVHHTKEAIVADAVGMKN
jgi:NADH dehydrogenase